MEMPATCATRIDLAPELLGAVRHALMAGSVRGVTSDHGSVAEELRRMARQLVEANPILRHVPLADHGGYADVVARARSFRGEIRILAVQGGAGDGARCVEVRFGSDRVAFLQSCGAAVCPVVLADLASFLEGVSPASRILFQASLGIVADVGDRLDRDAVAESVRDRLEVAGVDPSDGFEILTVDRGLSTRRTGRIPLVVECLVSVASVGAVRDAVPDGTELSVSQPTSGR